MPSSKSSSKKFWALLQIYQPFVMGGGVNQEYRYEIEGEELKIGKLKFFVANRHGRYWVHEVKTGGAVCSEKTRSLALGLVKQLVKEYPEDFKQQIKTIGDVMS